MAMWARIARVIGLVFTLTAVSFVSIGCTSTTPNPAAYNVYGEADAELNRDETGRPLSLVLNVYQLADRQTFARLTFDDFVSGKNDSDLLGEDFLQRSELVMLPSNKSTIDMKLLPETKYVGIVGTYRSPAEQRWRYLIPAAELRKSNLFGMSKNVTVILRLHDCHMEVEGVAIDVIPGQKQGVTPTCGASSQALPRRK